MGKIDWMERLGWSEEQIEDLRYTGYSYIKQGKYEIALAFFEALGVLEPENAYDAHMLGAIYLQRKQYNKALRSFDRALKLETGDRAPILLNLAKTFFAVGKIEEGLKIVQILKNESDPRVANVAKALLLAYTQTN